MNFLHFSLDASNCLEFAISNFRSPVAPHHLRHNNWALVIIAQFNSGCLLASASRRHNAKNVGIGFFEWSLFLRLSMEHEQGSPLVSKRYDVKSALFFLLARNSQGACQTMARTASICNIRSYAYWRSNCVNYWKSYLAICSKLIFTSNYLEFAISNFSSPHLISERCGTMSNFVKDITKTVWNLHRKKRCKIKF